MTKIAVIPDVQFRPGDNPDFLRKIGLYLEEKEPDVIVCIGDFADMPSLSSYDVGKKSFEGRRYRHDIEATKMAMVTLLQPLKERRLRDREGHRARYVPRMVLTLGNHEARITRAVNSDAKLDGTIGISDLEFEKDWEVYPFLEPVVIEGVAFCHYFTSGLLGRPCTSAQAQLTRKHMSCVAGHQQGLQIATGHRADGKRLTSIIAGSCYRHSEDYLGPQGNNHWRGMLMLHACKDGEFDPMFVSLDYLDQKYGK
jgi:hypothetical protein